jgi:hypothetical protein
LKATQIPNSDAGKNVESIANTYPTAKGWHLPAAAEQELYCIGLFEL